jgi:hypothetical protein
VPLRNRETGKVSRYFIVDAREILAMPNTIYERVADEDSSPPEAA